MRVSSCVDCGTSIIGECARCPACHDRHARNFEPSVEAIAPPREASALRILLGWLVASEILVAVVAGIVLGARGCT